MIWGKEPQEPFLTCEVSGHLTPWIRLETFNLADFESVLVGLIQTVEDLKRLRSREKNGV